MALKISEDLAAKIRAHGAETYPRECCGALLGRDAGEHREVLYLLPLLNRREDSPNNRYSITPEDFLKAQEMAREQGVELIGWYHSHPDHPALPSEFDREHAWPWYSYVIVSVERGEPKTIASWRLSDDRMRFSPEPIQSGAPTRAAGT